MHLLAAQPGAVLEGDEAVDLGQTPGDIVVLSVNDTDLGALAAAAARQSPDAPSLRLANLLALRHPLSVDLYVDSVIRHARLVVVRLLGGRTYWPYGLDEIAAACRETGAVFAALLDETTEAESQAASSASPDAVRRLGALLRQGGDQNADAFLRYAHALIGGPPAAPEAHAIPEAGFYWPGIQSPALDDLRARWRPDAAIAPILFYRAYVTASATAAIDVVIEALAARGLNPLPIFVSSLKDPTAAALVSRTFAQAPPDVVINTTAFASSAPGAPDGGVLAQADAPVLQFVFAGLGRDTWAASARGLAARDLAMNVALPEVDGRILAGAVAFKAEAAFDPRTQCAVTSHVADPDQLAHAADLAAAWARLRRTAPAQRRVALILANYPNKAGRIGNGVGLDTPESAALVLHALRDADYAVTEPPADGADLLRRLTAEPGERLPLADYEAFLATLPASVAETITARWGPPQDDPTVVDGAFRLNLHRVGGLVVGVQPPRGYGIDPKATYHDATLSPPHAYLAFYAWLRRAYAADAVVHLGKHGSLEWLPGKALALSSACFPQAILGPTPHLYPFIVNDPGEGAQAKRRSGAVIVDHLTPPLTRADSYGPLRALEALVDEYYAAAGLDPRRLGPLRDEILALATREGLDVDCGLDLTDTDGALAALDNYLCDLKELQIRDGLHIFGRSPEGRLRNDLLTALVRAPRRHGEAGDASLQRALADDLGLGFDPLDAALGAPWTGPRPAALVGDDAWRTTGDTVERLEHLATALVSGAQPADPSWVRTRQVLDTLAADLAPRVDACGPQEIAGLLAGFDGRFTPPGPSGAPTRGRPDVLPTGRNFFSVDTRAVPTPTAWRLGWLSAQRLCEDHLQRTGEPLHALAMSAWGTSNMRTGGDDIAQALALMGVRPVWEASTGRVTGFEVLPLVTLDRPRVDVTLRISGLFRDAFVEQVDLIAAAARAIQDLDEDPADNPAAARYRQDLAAGQPEADARARVFGAAPEAYGTGLQTILDEGLWTDRRDLAEAYLAWSAHAYGGGREGAPARAALEARLRAADAVLQNQDNREHDLLDSNDYAQFEGGLSAAIEGLTGAAPLAYHNDHSRPERPVIRTLDDELARIVRARLVNPKWIAGVMRHSYKGASEIAAGVDYLCAFAATTNAVRSHHFDLAYRAFIEDPAVRAFLADANPDALHDIVQRLRDAIARGLWTPRSNSAGHHLETLSVRDAA